MTEPFRQRVDELFDAALDLPAAERAAYVVEAAAGDPRLAAEVQALLRAHDRADGVLDGGPAAPAAAVPELPEPRRIGPYRILGELGRGGMGLVYAAERDDGQFQRRVAIKVLRADADPSLKARVVAERQILASLDHPHIARLLDGGITDDGRPFLVMEHVDGLPIDVYADRMRLTVEERIALFVMVADAVQHAHRNLIVHRDLKPTNILVTSRGEVKLLDFGIAKLLNPALGPHRAPITRYGERALTPEFAAPEQIRGEPVTTATDVYSLGVVLYRLLVGRHPYRFDDDSMASVVEVVARGRPRPPSEAVLRPAESGEATSAEIAEARRSTPSRLAHRLRGDLDAIVLYALRKEPVDRYGSPDLLVRDLQRHVNGRPVEARKGVQGYRTRAFLRRNRFALAGAAIIALSLITGAGAALWQAGLASGERDRAEEALAHANEMAGFLMGLFSVPDAADRRLEEITAADLLRRGLLRIEELESQPLVQARMLEVVGDVHRQLGQYTDAVALHRRSLAGRRAELGSDHPETARAMNALGLSLRELAEFDEARSLHREALRIQRAALGARDTAVATTLHHIAWIEFDLRRRIELQREMLEIREAAFPGGHPARQEILLSLANTERGLGNFDRAVRYMEQALREAQAALGESDPTAAVPLFHLGDIYRAHLNDPERAESAYRRGLAIQEAAVGPTGLLLIHGLHSLGGLLRDRGQYDEAERLLRRAEDILYLAHGPDHPLAIGSSLNLAELFQVQGRFAEADSIYRRNIRIWEQTRGPRHPSVAGARSDYARSLQRQERFEEAEAQMRAAIDIRSEGLGSLSILTGITLMQLGDILRSKGDLDQAERTYRQSLQILLDNLEPGHPQVQDVEIRLQALQLGLPGPNTSGRY